MKLPLLVCALALGVVAVLGSALEGAWADPIRLGRAPGSLARLRGLAVIPLPAKMSTVPPAPAPLDVAEKHRRIEIGGLTTPPGQVYFQVSPARPAVENRAQMVFLGSDMVDPGGNSAYFIPHLSDPHYVYRGIALWIKPERAGSRYLLDCALHNLIRAVTLHVTGPEGFATQTVDVDGGAHATWVMEAADNGWVGFNVGGRADDPWYLYSCEATAL